MRVRRRGRGVWVLTEASLWWHVYEMTLPTVMPVALL